MTSLVRLTRKHDDSNEKEDKNSSRYPFGGNGAEFRANPLAP